MTHRRHFAQGSRAAAGARLWFAAGAALVIGPGAALSAESPTAGRAAPEAQLATTAITPGAAPVSAAPAAIPLPGPLGADAAGCRIWVYAPASLSANAGSAVIAAPPAQGAIPAPPASTLRIAPAVAMALAPTQPGSSSAAGGAPTGPAGGQATQGGAAGAHGAGASAGGASPTGAGAALPASPAADAGPWLCREWRAAAR